MAGLREFRGKCASRCRLPPRRKKLFVKYVRILAFSLSLFLSPVPFFFFFSCPSCFVSQRRSFIDSGGNNTKDDPGGGVIVKFLRRKQLRPRFAGDDDEGGREVE